MSEMREYWRKKTGNLVWDVHVSPRDDFVVSGSWDNNIYAFDKKGKELWKYKTADYVGGVAIGRNGDEVACGSYDRYLYLLDSSGNLKWREKMDSYIRDIDEKDDFLAAVGWGGEVYLLNTDGKIIWKNNYKEPLLCVGVSSEGNVICGGMNMRITSYDNNGKELWHVDTGGDVCDLDMSDDGKHIVIGSSDTYIYLLDNKGNILWKYKTGGVVRGVALSSDGRFVFAASNGKYIYQFSKIGRILTIHKNDDDIWSIASSRFGEFIVVGTRGGEIIGYESKKSAEIIIEEVEKIIEKSVSYEIDIGGKIDNLEDVKTLLSEDNIEESVKKVIEIENEIKERMNKTLLENLKSKIDETKKKMEEYKSKGRNVIRMEWIIKKLEKYMEEEEYERGLNYFEKSQEMLEASVEAPLTSVEKPTPGEEIKEKIEEKEIKEKAEVEKDKGDEALAYLDKVMDKVASYLKDGFNMDVPEKMLEEASEMIADNRYDEALEKIKDAEKKAEEIVNIIKDAKEKLEKLDEKIKNLDSKGMDVSEIIANYDLTKDALEAGELDIMVTYLEQIEKGIAELEEQAKIAEELPKDRCPNCGKKVKPRWKSCPFCRTKLK